MKILFYANPMIVRGDPEFYLGAIRNKLVPQARLLQARGWQVQFVLNEFVAEAVRFEVSNVSIAVVTQRALSAALGSTQNVEVALYRNEGNREIARRLAPVIAAAVGDRPDAVVAWETPAGFLKEAFPEAMVIHQMPGFTSRMPFPELLTLDTAGLFCESTLHRYAGSIETWGGDSRAAEVVEDLRSQVLPFIQRNSPILRARLDPAGAFRRLLLLPLQVTDQYAFKRDTGFESQMALLLDCLSHLPADIGLVVTQYNAGKISDKALSAEIAPGLARAFPNLVWQPEFDAIDNISQYLLSQVDGVVTASSSIGLQALLWRKPLIVVGDTHLQRFATYESIGAYAARSGFEDGPSDGADRALQWLLCHQQPLLASVISDPAFLHDWLQALFERRPAAGIDTLPNFFDLQPGYRQAFRDAYKIERAEQVLVAKFGSRAIDGLGQRFSALLREAHPKIVSFDIFDTLLDRNVEQPAHVFQLMDDAVVRLTGGQLTGFPKVRQSAEAACRQRARDLEQRDEITLDEIYADIAERYELAQSTVDAIRELELAEERRALSRRQAGWALYRAARAACQRVIAVSDMYLSEGVLKELLDREGFGDIDAIYVSSSVGKRKHEGGLFEHVRDAERVAFDDWLHVGDNAHGDIAVPKAMGIKTFHLPRAFQNISANKRIGALVQADKKNRSCAEAVIYGAIQKRFFDNPAACPPADTHFGGDAYLLGYAGFGPLALGYLQWVMQSARQDAVEHLLFLSRDGKILWQIADILFPVSEGWPSRSYVFGSRRSARVASLRTRGDISTLVDSSLSAARVVDTAKGKFGIDLTLADNGLAVEHGFSGIEAVATPATDREKLRGFFLALSDRILASAESERQMLTDYYQRSGVAPGSRVAVVDIGYAGTMQVAIEAITGVQGLRGYYFITFESALANVGRTGPMRGYAGEFVKPSFHPNPICRNGFLYETLFCAPDDSFVAFAADRVHGCVPVFNTTAGDGVRKGFITRVHEGAVGLARDLRRTHGERASRMAINDATASRLLVDLLARPGGRDAELFEGVTFEDGFAGSGTRYIVPPRLMVANDRSVLSRAVWREGSEVFARRPDIRAAAGTPTPARSTAAASAIADRATAPARSRLHEKLRAFEARLVASLAGERKKLKYERNRALFFSDARSGPVQFYWRLVGQRLAG